MKAEDLFNIDETAVREARSMLRKWDQVHVNKEKSLEYNRTIKVYFYSPFIFSNCHLLPSWVRTVLDRIITTLRGEIPLPQRDNYIKQLELVEKVYSVVWDMVKEGCQEEQGRREMATLVHFSNRVDNLITLDDVLRDADKVPVFMAMWKELKNTKMAKPILVLCIKYFFQLVDWIVNKNRNPTRELQDYPKKTAKKVDDLKAKGNVLFQSNKYKKAARYYTQALHFDFYNAVLYCNRAQANLHLGRNWEAFLDAKRATLLNPGWPKAYYRLSQALYEMDNINRAINVNEAAQEVCRHFKQDTKDLVVQLHRFRSEKDRLNLAAHSCCDIPDDLETVESFAVEGDSGDEDEDESYKPVLEEPHLLVKEGSKLLRLDGFQGRQAHVFKKLENDLERRKREDKKRQKEMQLEEEMERKKEITREKKVREAEERRQMQKQKEIERKEKEKAKQEQVKQESRKARALERKGLLKDGSTAYLEGRGRVAFEHYQKVADMISQSKDKFGGFTEGDFVIFLYSRGMAALETCNPELYLFAMETFDNILENHKKIRTALPYYGKALAYFKMNRFKEAFDPIDKGTFIAEKFPSSVETWPGTSINIPQTEAGNMVKALAELKECCKNPPQPEAHCRYQNCDTRQEIYVSDLEFKGYVKIHCSDHCRMDYHLNCWKRCREDAQQKTDKDMLDTKCFTPDCPGMVIEITTYGSDGLEMSTLTNKEVQHEKTKTKTASKPTKKENKKSKKGKHKEKGQGDSSCQDPENTAPVHPSVEPPAPSSPPPPDPVGNGEETEAAEQTESEPVEEKEIHFEDITDAALLHQEPALILKKEEAELEEKKQPPKSSKSKSKKKKKEQPMTLEVGIDFMDRPSRHLISAEDATNQTSFYDAGYNQKPVISGGQEYQQGQLIILSEDEKSQVVVLHFHFLEILETNGPLKGDDSILTGEVEKLPADSRELIARHGGLPSFLVLCEEITMVEDYVCRSCDVEKCHKLLEQKKVVWTGLPQAGTQKQGPYSLGPATWQKPYYLSNGNAEPFVKKPKMNCLDSFGDFSISDCEDKSDGILSNSLSNNDEPFLSEDDSGSPHMYDDMHISLTKQDVELDSLNLLAKLPPARLTTQLMQDLNENSSHGVSLLDGFGTLCGEETVQTQPEITASSQESRGSRNSDKEASSVSSKVSCKETKNVDVVGKGSGDNSNEICQNVKKPVEPKLELASSSVEMNVANIPKGEMFDSSQRCHSGEAGSNESISSGISISGETDLMVVDKLKTWKESVRQVLSLFPEIILEKGEEDDILIRALTQQFYQHVKQLQAGRDKKLHDGKADLISVGSLAVVEIVSQAINTEPFKTFEFEYYEVKKKCDNMELSLSDTIRKYKSLEEMLISEQNRAKTKQIQQQGIIEEFQRKLQQSEERLKQEIHSSQAEKSSLLSMVHEQEGNARVLQTKLQEFENMKKLLDQTTAEKENLNKEKEELKTRVEQIGEECRLQRERAKKAEVSVIQIHKDQAIRPLEEASRECNYHIMNLKRIIERNPESTDISLFLKDWERCLEENKKKLETTKVQFDSQIKQLHDGQTLTDLPVIPRPEPSRSKMVKKQPTPSPPPPPNWHMFARPPFHPAPGVNGVPPMPMRPPHPYTAPPPGLVNPTISQTTTEDTPRTNSSAATTPSSTPPPLGFGLPPARGNLNGLPSGPGSTMPLAPGPAGLPPSPGMRPFPTPIGTRHAGGFPPAVPPTTQAVAREVKPPTTDSAALPQKAPQPVPDSAHMKGNQGPYNNTSNGGATAEPQGTTGPRSSYQRIMDRLSGKFPSYNKIQLTTFLKLVRANNGNSLSGLSMDGITKKVGELIAENELAGPRTKQLADINSNPQQHTKQPSTTPVVIAPAAPPSKSAWSALDDTPISWQAEQYDDEVDPCVICHEELVIKDVLDLECGHRFHADCIQEWLGTKSTCPNCRKYTKLKEEYPDLTA
ncbi:E3 ubiquitin-protein ligase TTC3 [Holothuria leucospilota]|uniref:RING-type E3 ubiquitin transferase n=1 Tax=Holothuria leucospilota TaxID=206669 RepID=A0A9Q1H652_HOLLE|nr:E3 ubiquitin-protein ligase TTC3 [Holothuria leucospilota]